MSGEMLIKKLRELHFPGGEKLDPQSFDWLFENEDVSPVLQWFCKNVSQSNILQPEEIEQYKKICETGEVVLKGRELEEALTNLGCVNEDSLTEESLQDEILQLEASLQYHKKQKARLSRRRTMQSNHLTALSHRLSKLNVVEAKAKSEYKKALETTHKENVEMNQCLEGLKHTVKTMNQLYSGTGVSNHRPRSDSPTMFLSQLPLQQYYRDEEDYTTQLTSYTKKQFFQGIAEMTSCGEDSRYEILEVSDPDSLLVRGENLDVNIRDCKELARLQALYTKSEKDQIEALISMKKVQGQLFCSEKLLDTIKSGTFSTDLVKNKERLQKLQGSLQVTKRDFMVLTERDIPNLIQECKEAKVLRVLTGDYDLKLARQDYFTSNQDKVINQLIVQRSRNEFLTMALELELKKHRDFHHILTSLHSLLTSQYSQWQARMTVMKDRALTSERHNRETVDSRDKSTERLHRILDDESSSDQQLFLTYSSLVDNAERLSNRHTELTNSLSSTSNTGLDNIQALENNLTVCESVIYEGSSTTSGQPQLTPRQIEENIVQFQELLKQLEKGIMDIVKDVDSKKKLLKTDTLIAREKKLFTYFFTNPGKLHQTLKELEARLEAEKHIDKTDNR